MDLALAEAKAPEYRYLALLRLTTILRICRAEGVEGRW